MSAKPSAIELFYRTVGEISALLLFSPAALSIHVQRFHRCTAENLNEAQPLNPTIASIESVSERCGFQIQSPMVLNSFSILLLPMPQQLMDC